MTIRSTTTGEGRRTRFSRLVRKFGYLQLTSDYLVPHGNWVPKFIGPFKIKKMLNPVAFELALPNSYKMHPVFHASLLKPVSSPFSGREEPPPPPVKIDGENEFEVESILGCRNRGGQLQYLNKKTKLWDF